jgi:hypothetical protein
MLSWLINTNKIEFRTRQGVRGGAKEKEDDKKKVKINLKILTKFQNNPSTDGFKKFFETLWGLSYHLII